MEGWPLGPEGELTTEVTLPEADVKLGVMILAQSHPARVLTETVYDPRNERPRS